jgi:MFS family permease
MTAEPARDLDQRLAVKLTLLLTGTMTIMAGTTISPALPALHAHFADTPRIDYLVRMLITVPSIAIALCSPLAGWIVDTFGRKRLMVAGIVAYGFAGTSGFFLDSMTALLVSRGLLGVAVACVMASSSTLVGDYFSGRVRERFMGFRQGFIQFGGVVFVILGGFIATIDWRAPFLVYLLAFGVLPLAIFFIFEPPRPAAPGTAAANPAAADSAPIGLMALLYSIELVQSAAFYMIPTQLPFYIHELGVIDPLLTGLALAIPSLVSALVSILIFARLRRMLSRQAIFFLGFSSLGAGYILLSQVDGLNHIMLSLIFVGIALGTIWPNISLWVIDRAPARMRGRILGGLTMAVFCGHFLSPLISQTMAQSIGLLHTYAVMGGAVLMMGLMFLVATYGAGFRRRGAAT